jgi:hypothetical protein
MPSTHVLISVLMRRCHQRCHQHINTSTQSSTHQHFSTQILQSQRFRGECECRTKVWDFSFRNHPTNGRLNTKCGNTSRPCEDFKGFHTFSQLIKSFYAFQFCAALSSFPPYLILDVCVGYVMSQKRRQKSRRRKAYRVQGRKGNRQRLSQMVCLS